MVRNAKVETINCKWMKKSPLYVAKWGAHLNIYGWIS